MTDESVFAAALAISSPAERDAYLDHACAENPALRKEVEGLLAAHAASNPLDRPPGDLARTGAYEAARDAVANEAVGALIAGRYKLIERIGEGGMGCVYMAQQTEPIRRLVAVKVIREGMDSRQILARFEAERQALAMMDHPNIAKVLDAGTTESRRPFFVMELVKGVPITKFCDDSKLSPRERLELFVPVCRAIQHAHQKGIIHRDIKPSNVLVALYDGKPVPKVIDFGVAKAAGQPLTDKTLVTGFGAIVGTPEYMSPEQAELNQLDIDTRSDVFALGVLMYELLTGTTPLDRARLGQAALLEILRVVREEEPPKPSTRISTSAALAGIAASRSTDPARLSRLVRGELDWIVMKALEKDRNRRYDTPTALAKDVDRYLSGDAVEAYPPTLGYRLKKAYRKNRAAVVTASLFGLFFVVGAGFSAWQATRASIAEAKEKFQRQRAEHNLEIAEAETRKVIKSEADAVRERDEALRQKAVAERQALESKAAQSVLFLGLRESLRDWPRHRFEETPERPVSVERLLSGVVNTLDQTLPWIYEDNPSVQARTRGLLAWLLDDLGLEEAAERQYVAALKLYRRESKDIVTDDAASALYGLATILIRQGKYTEAEPVLRQVVDWHRRAAGDKALITRKASNQLAESLVGLGNAAEAAQVAKQTLEVGRRAHGDDDETTQESMEILGRIYSLKGEWDEAERLLRRALELRRRINTPEYPPRLKTTEELGMHFLRRNKPGDAAGLFRESLAIREKQEPDSWTTFNARSMLGESLLVQKNFAEAEPLLLSGYEGMKQREKHIPTPAKLRLSEAADRLVQLYNAWGKPEKAAIWRFEITKNTLPQAPLPREVKR